MFTKYVILLIFPATILGMQNPGMQEIAKHKAEFQVGLKKLLEKAPDDFPLDEYSPVRYEYEMQKSKAIREAAKGLEAIFNTVTKNKYEEHLPAAAVVDQDPDYKAVDKYINEIKDVQYTYDLGTPGRIDEIRQQRDVLVSGWKKITAELARSKAELADHKKQLQESKIALSRLKESAETNDRLLKQNTQQQKELAYFEEAVQESKFENQKQKRLIREQQTTISEKEKALEQAAIELAKENASLVQLQHPFSETTHQLAELKAVFNIMKEENADLKKNQTKNGLNRERMMSLLALFENSQATGWESSFIQAVKEELK